MCETGTVLPSLSVAVGVGQPGCFLDGQRVHVGPQHDGRPLALPEQAYDTDLAHAGRHFIPGRTEPLGGQSRRAGSCIESSG